MNAQLGKQYAEGKVYAFFLPRGYTDVWSLGEWHSVCISLNGSNNIAKIYLDGSMVFNTTQFYKKGDFKYGNITLFHKSDDSHQTDKSIQYQVQTEITEFNIWNKTMSTSFIESWSNCESTIGGNYLNWSSTKNFNFPSYFEDLDKICSKNKNLFIHQELMNLAETKQFCAKMGGGMSVATDNQTLNDMIVLFKNKDGSWLEECGDGFFIGYSDEKEEGSWVSIEDDTPITVDHLWANEYPTKNSVFNQAVFRDGQIFNRWEKNKYCPVCTSPKQRLFELDNLCDEDHDIDKFYVMVNTSYFIGLKTSKLYKNQLKVWVIESSENTGLIANLSVPQGQDDEEFIPTGLHSWFYRRGECNNGFVKMNLNGQLFILPSRQMNLHLAVDRPGNFCCSDGTCINSELVCDGNQDCSDDEDDFNDRIKLTQRREIKANQGIDVLVNVTIMNLLEVSQEKSTFTVFFWIKLEWKNGKHAFEFLHDDFQLNNVQTMTNSSVWIPHLKYYHIYDDQFRTLKSTTYIEKGLSQNVSMSPSPLRPTEVYEGSKNTFMMDILHREIFMMKQLILYLILLLIY